MPFRWVADPCVSAESCFLLKPTPVVSTGTQACEHIEHTDDMHDRHACLYAFITRSGVLLLTCVSDNLDELHASSHFGPTRMPGRVAWGKDTSTAGTTKRENVILLEDW
eukprot:TRINITY_DN35461_c0_g1_i2.p6 TRINITY_DN35461_c0_g1~~TRINITY_DN35461_c0_g1_i2.p6  ORF type:complete len:109 (-),score=6.37 TRINITY_DN35461_c0_g1_i2:1366-1692(-)